MGYVEMRDLAKAVSADIGAALDAIAKKHGLQSLKMAGGSIASGSFTLKVEGIAAGGKTREAERYELNEKVLKLPPLGHVFQQGAHTYKTVGLNTTGSKVLVSRIPDGKEFSMSVVYIQHLPVEPAEPVKKGRKK
jgi:hypothetical protein